MDKSALWARDLDTLELSQHRMLVVSQEKVGHVGVMGGGPGLVETVGEGVVRLGVVGEGLATVAVVAEGLGSHFSEVIMHQQIPKG